MFGAVSFSLIKSVAHFFHPWGEDSGEFRLGKGRKNKLERKQCHSWSLTHITLHSSTQVSGTTSKGKINNIIALSINRTRKCQGLRSVLTRPQRLQKLLQIL